MKISGICYIETKFGEIGPMEERKRDIELVGRSTRAYAYGQLSWCDTLRNEDKEEYVSYTKKRFICFGLVAEQLYALRKKPIVIEGYFKTERYVKDGAPGSREKIFITKASIYEKQNEEAKGDESNIDEVPF